MLIYDHTTAPDTSTIPELGDILSLRIMRNSVDLKKDKRIIQQWISHYSNKPFVTTFAEEGFFLDETEESLRKEKTSFLAQLDAFPKVIGEQYPFLAKRLIESFMTDDEPSLTRTQRETIINHVKKRIKPM